MYGYLRENKMKIKDILTIDLTEDITNVIDMENVEDEELLTEIQDYIVTDGLAEKFDELATVFTSNIKEKGVWLSGFYGSGKSYLGKLWGYMLSNPTLMGTPARERILQRFSGVANESIIKNDIERLGNHKYLVVKFDIAKQNTDHGIAVTMLDNFLKTIGLPNNIYGMVLYQMMIEENCTDVEDYIGKHTNVEWKTARKKMISYSKLIKEIYLDLGNTETDFQMLHKTLSETRDHYDASKLKDTIEQYLEINKGVEIVFLFDEASEAITQKKFSLLDLEGISEAFSAIVGQVWTMAIAQEKLDDVINNFNVNRSQLTKMTDRFKTKIHIEATEVDVIIKNRLLQKTDSGWHELENYYDANFGMILDAAMLHGTGLAKTDSRDNFATYYPFYEYQLDLMQNFLFGKKGYASTNVATRGMIISAFDVLKKEVQEEELFSSVTAWQMTNQAQPQPDVLLVNRYDNADAILKNVDSKVSGRRLLEVIHFLDDAGNAPTTYSNIVKAYISSPEEFHQIDKDIEEALSILIKARILIDNGGRYRITSDIEQRLMDEMNDFDIQGYSKKAYLISQYKNSAFIKQIANVQDNAIRYDFYLKSDDGDELTSPKEKSLSCIVKSLYNISDDRNSDINSERENYKDTPSVMYMIPDNSEFEEIDAKIDQIRRYEAIIDKYPSKDSEEAPYIKDFGKMKEDMIDSLNGQINKALRKSTIVYQFNIYILKDMDAEADTATIERQLISNVYSKRLDTQLKDDIAGKVIKESLNNKLHNYFTSKDFEFFDNTGTFIGDKLRVTDEVISRIKNSFVDGATLSDDLQNPPTGYSFGTVIGTVAALMRAGQVKAKFAGEEKYSYKDKDVDLIFKNSVNFRKASFKAVAESLELTQKKEIVDALQEYDPKDRNGKKITWNSNDFDIVCAISEIARKYTEQIDSWKKIISDFSTLYPELDQTQKILSGFAVNITDSNYISKAKGFLNSKDIFIDNANSVIDHEAFIQKKQPNILAWREFINRVIDDVNKTAESVSKIKNSADLFETEFGTGVFKKYNLLQDLYQAVKDEYYKKWCAAGKLMTDSYTEIRDQAQRVLDEAETLNIDANVLAVEKLKKYIQLAEGRICIDPQIGTSISESHTKMTYSEVCSANKMAGQDKMDLYLIEVGLVRQKADSSSSDAEDNKVNEDNGEAKSKSPSKISRSLPKSGISASSYKSWLESELKQTVGLKDDDIIEFPEA